MTPVIYNLFPRLVGPLPRWVEHARRAREMHFNWLYVNPWHYAGFSGSLYAAKELRQINPLFLPADADPHSLDPLRDFTAACAGIDLPVMMDLVINHTSKDSPLIDEHPDWFVRDGAGEVVSPSVTDPDDPEKVTVWGDLAEVDNAGSPDRDALWEYWADLVRDSLDLGFGGFRCDAAYKVPAELWALLIREARAINPEARFFAETLGAPETEVLALRDAGFDFFFNSSKWWNFRDDWALEQHERFGAIAPSISFPETHDTPRLAAETDGDEAVQRQRYAFAAAFSAGVMMPLGYEYGFRKQVNVVSSMPSDWERPRFDLTGFVAEVNRLKLQHPHLHGEGQLARRSAEDEPVLVLERRVAGSDDPAYVVVNTNVRESRTVSIAELPEADRLRLYRWGGSEVESGAAPGEWLELERAEVAYLLPPAEGPART